MSIPLVKFENVTFRKFHDTVFPNTNWEMHPNETWAIIGPNGSGKTTFLEAIEGQLMKLEGQVLYHIINENGNIEENPQTQIASVYFNDRTINYGHFYYQQRYHATETEGIITVRDFLQLHDHDASSMLKALDIDPLLDMEIIKLSNGQFKKVLIIKAFLKQPRLLLLDNLFTGLDSHARTYMTDLIERIIEMGTHVVMAISGEHLPEVVSHVMEIDHFAIRHSSPHQYIHIEKSAPIQIPPFPNLPCASKKISNPVIELRNVTVTYHSNQVLDHVNWTVLHGEKWALMGPNGAGKSMLLSLIFADNPQAYANNMVLFGRQRGTGESIWDIKSQIGFVSPEMHLYFPYNHTCKEIALSGLLENPYTHYQITENDVRLLDILFNYFSLAPISDKAFMRLSTGQQNIILLIRAMMKNPPVLILDEPFQGFDTQTVTLAKHLLDIYCLNRTLIFVSHEPDELPSCINRYLFLQKGIASEKTTP